MRSSNLEIASPCHESWEAMEGAGASKFCGVCQKDVHDLSAMAQAEAQALLRERSGESLCVRYSSEADGTLRFRDLVPRASLTRKIVRAAFAASMLAACTPSESPTMQDLGASILESIRADTVPTADGGCDYTTGPFTTFHLPAGHAFCRTTGDVPQEPMPEGIALGNTGVPEQFPPPESTPDPEPPKVDPQAMPPRMGQAIAMPEVVDPLVPCDTQPGFAAPPPPVQPEPKSYPIKGRMKVKPEPRHKMGGTMVRPDDDDPI